MKESLESISSVKNGGNRTEPIAETYTIEASIASTLMEIVQEYNHPFTMTHGKKIKDPNGSYQVDILIEYEEENKDLLGDLISKAINAVYGLDLEDITVCEIE